MVVLPESSANILHNSQISFLREKRTADPFFALTIILLRRIITLESSKQERIRCILGLKNK